MRRGNDRAVAGLRRRLRDAAVRRAAAEGRAGHPLLHAQPLDRDGLDPAGPASARAVAADVNRLAHETSPYLLQHASNPVDWYPWGDEAFAAARGRDVPIMLSIGYSACHWCHVMEHESFADDAVAEVMNRLFVSVKVDREERPDVDAIYMDAVVSLTGSGGWPMTVFLTPDGRAVLGRHVLPARAAARPAVVPPGAGGRHRGVPVATRRGRPAGRPADEGDRQPRLDGEARPARPRLRSATSPSRRWPASSTACTAASAARRSSRRRRCCRSCSPHGDPARAMAVATLDAMADGGIHDQLGGGFHRYAVDGRWLVPHFEKMLYDNALLARAYAIAAVATGESRYARWPATCSTTSTARCGSTAAAWPARRMPTRTATRA